MSRGSRAAHLPGMEFSEHEMTVAVTAAAKTIAYPTIEATPEQVDAHWEAMTPIARFHAADRAGNLVLPVLRALPEVTVEPNTRPRFTDEQILTAAQEATAAEPTDPPDVFLDHRLRAALTKVALAYLPARRDPDTVLDDNVTDTEGPDGTDPLDGLDVVVVPDSPEGL